MTERTPDDDANTWAEEWQRMQSDRSSVDDLLVAYLPRLRAFVRAKAGGALGPDESRSDVVASVCREFLAREETFEFRSEPAFRAWLFTAAANKLRARHRDRHAQKRAPDREVRIDDDGDGLLRGYASVTSPSGHVAAREHIEILEEALGRLEPDHREVICHARLAELPLAEVAQVMDKTEGAVRGLLGRALVKLSAELKRAGIAPA